MDRVTERLTLATKLGAIPLDLGSGDVPAMIRAANGGRGVDVALEVSAAVGPHISATVHISLINSLKWVGDALDGLWLRMCNCVQLIIWQALFQ